MAAKKKKTDPLRDCVPVLRALADAGRMEIVRLLARGEQPVTALAHQTGLTMYTASRQLKVLRDAGLVETEVRAQQRIYRLSAPILAELERNENVLELGCCSFRLGS